MADLPTRADFFALGRDYLLQKSKKVDPAQVDVEGSDVNIFVGVTSVMCAKITRALAAKTGALTLDGCETDEELDRWAFDRYQQSRKGAAAARGNAVLTRPTVAAGGGTVPIGTTILTTTGTEYVTTSPAYFGALDLSSSCTVRASQAGKATQIGKNALSRFAQPQNLFDSTILVTNPVAMAGGEDRETNDLFKERLRNYWLTSQKAILSAIEQGAVSVPGVVSATAVEALTSGGNPARVINLYIADSSGVASQALADDVAVALNDYRAAGITVLIWTSIPLIVELEFELKFRAGVDTKTLSDQVRVAIFEFVNSLPVNGTLYVGQIYSVLQRFEADGVIPDQASIVAPVGDLVPPLGETIRTTLENVVIR